MEARAETLLANTFRGSVRFSAKKWDIRKIDRKTSGTKDAGQEREEEDEGKTMDDE